MLIREWKFEDILAVSRLEEECFTGERWSYQTLVSCFENPRFYGLVAEEGGEVTAYGGITVVEEDADLENILVAENYRRGGVGTEILVRLLAEAAARGAEKVFLEVRVSNVPAMKLYLNNGFVGVHARTRYYSDNEDCLVMRKILTQSDR